MIFTQEDPPTAAVLFREFKQLGGQNDPVDRHRRHQRQRLPQGDRLRRPPMPYLISVFGTSVTGAANYRVHRPVQQALPEPEGRGPARQRQLRLRRRHLAGTGRRLREDHQRHHGRQGHDQGDQPARHGVLHLLVLPEAAEGRERRSTIEGASGSLDYNQYNNTFGPYGAFQSTPRASSSRST